MFNVSHFLWWHPFTNGLINSSILKSQKNPRQIQPRATKMAGMNEMKTSDTDQAPVVEPRVGGATPPSAEMKNDEPDEDGKEHGR